MQIENWAYIYAVTNCGEIDPKFVDTINLFLLCFGIGKKYIFVFVRSFFQPVFSTLLYSTLSSLSNNKEKINTHMLFIASTLVFVPAQKSKL